MVVVFRLNHLDISLSAQNHWGSESVVDYGFLSIPQILRAQGPGFTWSEGSRSVILSACPEHLTWSSFWLLFCRK